MARHCRIQLYAIVQTQVRTASAWPVSMSLLLLRTAATAGAAKFASVAQLRDQLQDITRPSESIEF